jgi:hypothetical protein
MYYLPRYRKSAIFPNIKNVLFVLMQKKMTASPDWTKQSFILSRKKTLLVLLEEIAIPG